MRATSVKPAAVEHRNRAGVDRRATDPGRFEGRHVDGMPFDSGRAVVTRELDRRAQERRPDAASAVATVDLEAAHPPGTVTVFQHAGEGAVAQHSPQRRARTDPRPAHRMIIDVRDESGRHDGVRDLGAQRVTLARRPLVPASAETHEDLTPARRSATTPPSEQRLDVVPALGGNRPHL